MDSPVLPEIYRTKHRGRFLVVGKKDITIGRDEAIRSGDSVDNALQIKATRQEMMSAPEFETQG